MEMMIKGLVKKKNTYKSVNIFSYSTNGIPGLEIKVGSKNSKLLKEKMIYLTRKSSVQIPLKRYVICIEDEEAIQRDELKFLELPILILYWTLANQLKISNLADCICGGQVQLDGTIRPLVISGEYLNFFNSIDCKKRWKIISTRDQKECRGLLRLPVEEIIILPLVEKVKSIGS